jgi:hypothetical protein
MQEQHVTIENRLAEIEYEKQRISRAVACGDEESRKMWDELTSERNRLLGEAEILQLQKREEDRLEAEEKSRERARAREEGHKEYQRLVRKATAKAKDAEAAVSDLVDAVDGVLDLTREAQTKAEELGHPLRLIDPLSVVRTWLTTRLSGPLGEAPDTAPGILSRPPPIARAVPPPVCTPSTSWAAMPTILATTASPMVVAPRSL